MVAPHAEKGSNRNSEALALTAYDPEFIGIVTPDPIGGSCGNAVRALLPKTSARQKREAARESDHAMLVRAPPGLQSIPSVQTGRFS